MLVGRKTFVSVLVLLVAVIFYKLVNSPVLTPILTTKYGKVRGVIGASRDGRIFHKFMGIRYAKAPVNELRFESPHPPEPWNDVFDADDFGNECAQIDFLFGWKKGDEDCLFLNVYTPKIDSKDMDKPYPVIFFIHGGILISGSANMYGPEYFMDQDVVLVTVNYRLASLGFLNTGDGLIRGNMGLKDQVFAMGWVQENIAQFGGDPKRVTLFGNNAGGTSVHYHMLSKMSEGLFEKAITQSSSALGSWAFQRDYKRQAERYIQHLNCTRSSGKEVVNCLKQLPVSKILDVHVEVLDPYRDPISLFAPTLESVHGDANVFISKPPLEIMKNGAMHKKPWIAGFTSHEGLFFSGELMKNESKFKEFNNMFTSKLGRFLYIGDPPAEVMSRMKDFYFGVKQQLYSKSQINNFTNFGSDLTFTFGVYSSIELQSQYGPVYPYYYTFKGENTVMDLLMDLQYKLPPTLELGMFIIKKIVTKNILGMENPHNYGPCGTDDLLVLFKMQSYEIGSSDKDYKFSKKMVKILADFATDEKSIVIQGQAWLPFSASNKKFLKMDNEFKMINPPNQDRFNFLKTLSLIK